MSGIRLELRILRRESAWLAISIVYAGLLAYGCLQSVDRVRSQQKQVAAAAEDYRVRWENLRKAAAAARGMWSDTRSASLVGGPDGFAVMWLPLDGTAALSPGESLRRSRVRQVSIYETEPEPPLENPLIAAAGPFDLAFVVLWLLPLSVIATTYMAVSGSRENGTWPLVVVSTPNPAAIAILRILLPAGSLWGLTCLAGLATVFAAGGTGAAGWGRVVLWAMGTGVYAALWAAFSAWTNARASTPAVAIRLAGIVWLAAVWVIPGSIDALAGFFLPPVNRLESHLAAREVQRDLDEKLPAMVEQVYSRHPNWRPTPEVIAAATKPVPGGPASRDSRRVYAPSLVAVELTRPFRERVAERTESVDALTSWLAIASPVLAMQSIGDALAGTSGAQFNRFERQAQQATDTWHGFFGPRIFLLRDMTPEDLRDVPVPPAARMSFAWVGLAQPASVLMLWCAGMSLLVNRHLRQFYR